MTRHISHEPDPKLIKLIRPAETILLLVIIVVAVFILILWMVPPLGELVPHYWAKMRANSAAGLLLAAVSLALTGEQASEFSRRIGLAAGFLVLTLGVLTLGEYITGVPFGIDTWLPHDPHLHFPGRPSPQTACEFVVLGLCLLTSHCAKTLCSMFGDIFALMFTCLTLVMFGGHLYGAINFVGDDPSNLMSNHTLLLFFCCSTLIVLRRAERGDLMAVLLNIGIGSHIIRMVMPPAIFAPFLFLAVDAYFTESGLLSRSYAHAISSASAATLILFLVTWMGWRINAMERDLRDLSLTDELTGVYNRRGFYFLGEQAVREASRAGHLLALFYFDLDGLKRVNDVLGHEAGSDMIQSFARLLGESFRQGDIIGRLGGDEFAVITMRDPETRMEELLRRLEAHAAAFNDAEAHDFRLRFSTGYAEFSAGEADTLEELITRADVIMYQDKARRKQAA